MFSCFPDKNVVKTVSGLWCPQVCLTGCYRSKQESQGGKRNQMVENEMQCSQEGKCLLKLRELQEEKLHKTQTKRHIVILLPVSGASE